MTSDMRRDVLAEAIGTEKTWEDIFKSFQKVQYDRDLARHRVRVLEVLLLQAAAEQIPNALRNEILNTLETK